MRPEVSLKRIEQMSPAERHALALEKIRALTEHLMTLTQTHANNEIISFSSLLCDQVPESRAAIAFIDFQDCMFMAELVRLCAAWDDVDLHKESVPTVIALLNDKRTLAHIRRTRLLECFEQRDQALVTRRKDLSAGHMRQMRAWAWKEKMRRIRWAFRLCHRRVSRLGVAAAKSQRLADLAGFRDRYVAHNIDVTKVLPRSKGRDYVNPQYG